MTKIVSVDLLCVGQTAISTTSQIGRVIRVSGQRLPIPVRRRPVTGLGGGAFGFCLNDSYRPRGRRGADDSWPQRVQDWPRRAAQTRHSHSQVGASLQTAHIEGSSGRAREVAGDHTDRCWQGPDLQVAGFSGGDHPAARIAPSVDSGRLTRRKDGMAPGAARSTI